LKSVPEGCALSVTPNQGKEFSLHEQVTKAMEGMPFYFPKSHAPWKKTTNENTNGLIREYCLKSIDMDSFDVIHFDTFIDKLNRRPRKCLVWKSSYEIFYSKMLHLT